MWRGRYKFVNLQVETRKKKLQMQNKGEKRPLILIGNDDGVWAKGIKTLAELASEFGDVVVVAPMQHQSGKSSAVTLLTPLFVNKLQEDKGMTVYGVEGTPADCAKIAIDHLLADKRPQLLLSGINHGLNCNINALYSGTLGFAFEGLFAGIPSVAFSYGDYGRDADFTPCVPVVRDVVARVLERGLPEKVVLNVNMPRLAAGEKFKGVKVVSGARGRFHHVFDKRTTPFGRDYYWLAGEFVPENPDDDSTDLYWLNRGWVSATPCRADMTDFEAMPAVADLLK